MGKKKDKEKSKFRASPFDYMEGGRISKMGERYGVDKSDYNVNYGRDQSGPGGSKYKGGREEYEKAIQDAAMRDYDTRRTMEAQAMSGKKKARKYAEEGFGSIEDVIKANNMRERWHKKAGNGGSFSSASDFAGQTMRAVERDREKFIAANDAKYASKADLASMKDKMNDDPGQARQVTEGKSFNDYMKGTFGSKYEEIARGPAPYTDGDMDGGTAAPSASESASGPTVGEAAAQSNLADTVAALSDVGAAAKNKSKMGMYALGSITGGV